MSSTGERTAVLSTTGKTIIERLVGVEGGVVRYLWLDEDAFFEVKGAGPVLKQLASDGLITIKPRIGSYGKLYRIVGLVVC